MTAGTFLTTVPRPPIRLAEPGRINIEVTPPSSAVSKPGSTGQIECSAQTLAVTGEVASLPSSMPETPGLGYTPRCEWMSMMPGVSVLPFASTTRAPSGGVRPVPMAAIFPPVTSTSVFSRRSPVPVSTVAPRIRTGAAVAGT